MEKYLEMCKMKLKHLKVLQKTLHNIFIYFMKISNAHWMLLAKFMIVLYDVQSLTVNMPSNLNKDSFTMIFPPKAIFNGMFKKCDDRKQLRGNCI